MKKYLVTRSYTDSSISDNQYHINAPNLESIKRWVTESQRFTITSVYDNSHGSIIIFTNGPQFMVCKWKEIEWLTL